MATLGNSNIIFSWGQDVAANTSKTPQMQVPTSAGDDTRDM